MYINQPHPSFDFSPKGPTLRTNGVDYTLSPFVLSLSKEEHRSRRMNTVYSLLFAMSVCFTHTALANDSAASVAAGGIQFHKTPGIVMEKEDLFISPERVKVSYVFKNVTDKDITVEVFFPIPPLTEVEPSLTWDKEVLAEMADQEKRNHPDRAVPQPSQPAPFEDFSVSVDGQKITYKTEVRALQNGKDITDIFVKNNLPLSFVLATCNYPMESEKDNKTCGDRMKRYQSLGLLAPDGPLYQLDPAKAALWQKQINYHWTQTFPKGKETKIEHAYRPAQGSFFFETTYRGHLFPEVLAEQLVSRGEQLEKACLDRSIGAKEAFIPWLIRGFQTAPATGRNINFYTVDYILKTGANWDGPIRDFTLTIEYPKDGNVASCFPFQAPLKDIGNNQLQFHQKDFKPEQDLKILFGEPWKS